MYKYLDSIFEAKLDAVSFFFLIRSKTIKVYLTSKCVIVHVRVRFNKKGKTFNYLVNPKKNFALHQTGKLIPCTVYMDYWIGAMEWYPEYTGFCGAGSQDPNLFPNRKGQSVFKTQNHPSLQCFIPALSAAFRFPCFLSCYPWEGREEHYTAPKSKKPGSDPHLLMKGEVLYSATSHSDRWYKCITLSLRSLNWWMMMFWRSCLWLDWLHGEKNRKSKTGQDLQGLYSHFIIPVAWNKCYK